MNDQGNQQDGCVGNPEDPATVSVRKFFQEAADMVEALHMPRKEAARLIEVVFNAQLSLSMFPRAGDNCGHD